MSDEKYLFWFRFCFPVDWVNKEDHEIIHLFFIVAESQEEALNWGNICAEKFVKDLFAENKYDSQKVGFSSFIWEGWENASGSEKEELESFPTVYYGEFPVLSFEAMK